MCARARKHKGEGRRCVCVKCDKQIVHRVWCYLAYCFFRRGRAVELRVCVCVCVVVVWWWWGMDGSGIGRVRPYKRASCEWYNLAKMGLTWQRWQLRLRLTCTWTTASGLRAE